MGQAKVSVDTWLLILDAQLGFSERLSNEHGSSKSKCRYMVVNLGCTTWV
jgi:hypothetical protein